MPLILLSGIMPGVAVPRWLKRVRSEGESDDGGHGTIMRAALVGAAVALVGSIAGAGASLWVTHAQLQGDEKARAEARLARVQQERRDAYGEIASQLARMQQRANASEYMGGELPTLAELDSEASRLNELRLSATLFLPLAIRNHLDETYRDFGSYMSEIVSISNSGSTNDRAELDYYIDEFRISSERAIRELQLNVGHNPIYPEAIIESSE